MITQSARRSVETRETRHLSERIVTGLSLATFLLAGMSADTQKDIGTLPPDDRQPATASSYIPSPVRTSDEVPPTPSDTPVSTHSPAASKCIPGTPVSFTWTGIIENAPVESVGLDGDAVAAPENRGPDGGYNTVGWYKDGSKPGEPGLGTTLAHSTNVEKSLLPRKALETRLAQWVAKNITSEIVVQQDNGSTCRFSVSPQDIHFVTDKQKNYSSLIKKLDDEARQSQSSNLAFVTCSGGRNAKTGTSQDSIVVRGKLVNP